MTKITDEQVEQIINYLRGTCNSLCNVLESMNEDWCDDDLTQAQLEHIDEEIFCCTTCDWWYEISQQSEDGETCDECTPNDD